MHLNIDRALNEFFKKYIANFANESESKFIKNFFWLLKKQNDCKVTENTCENDKKKLRKNKS